MQKDQACGGWFILLMLSVFGAVCHWLLVQAIVSVFANHRDDHCRLDCPHQFPDRWTLVGAAVIVASGLYIVHREHRLRVRNSAALDVEVEALAKKL